MRHHTYALDLPLTEKTRCGEAEDHCRALGLWPLIGTDEVGRGPLAGPVVTAAVLLQDGAELPGLNDSKLLSHAQRLTLGPLIERQALAFAVVFADVAQIEARNILGASLWAMGQAVGQVQQQLRDRGTAPPALVLVDGHMPVPGLALPQRTLVKGDSRSRAIAAASILAKLARDAYMDALENQYPGYGFAAHKGYGVPQHMLALQRLGPCREHRRSFAPVAALWPKEPVQGALF
jgi:ribonuclease HII